MVLCNDIMWIIGQYVEAYRNNKKIETLFNIVPTETQIQNTTDKYNNMKYKDILYCYKFDKRHYNDFNVRYYSGKNGTKTKSDKQKELVIYELREIINIKFNRLRKQFKYNNPNYPNMKNLITGKKIHNSYALSTNQEYINQFMEYLKFIINEKDKKTLELYEKLIDDYLNEREYSSLFIKQRDDFINTLKNNYNIRDWENSWVDIKNPKPLKICNLYDTFVPKEFLNNNPRRYILWK